MPVETSAIATKIQGKRFSHRGCLVADYLALKVKSAVAGFPAATVTF